MKAKSDISSPMREIIITFKKKDMIAIIPERIKLRLNELSMLGI